MTEETPVEHSKPVSRIVSTICSCAQCARVRNTQPTTEISLTYEEMFDELAKREITTDKKGVNYV